MIGVTKLLFPMGYFQWVIFNGLFPMGYFQWVIFNGLFPMGYFQWVIFNGLFSMGYFQWVIFNGLLSVICIAWSKQNGSIRKNQCSSAYMELNRWIYKCINPVLWCRLLDGLPLSLLITVLVCLLA